MLPAADFRRSYPTAPRHAPADAAAARQLPLLLPIPPCASHAAAAAAAEANQAAAAPSLQMRAILLLMLSRRSQGWQKESTAQEVEDRTASVARLIPISIFALSSLNLSAIVTSSLLPPPA